MAAKALKYKDKTKVVAVSQDTFVIQSNLAVPDTLAMVWQGGHMSQSHRMSGAPNA